MRGLVALLVCLSTWLHAASLQAFAGDGGAAITMCREAPVPRDVYMEPPSREPLAARLDAGDAPPREAPSSRQAAPTTPGVPHAHATGAGDRGIRGLSPRARSARKARAVLMVFLN